MTPNGNGNTVVAVAVARISLSLAWATRCLAPPCPSCSLGVLSQLFHVMSPLFRGFLAALAFHFDSLASAKKAPQHHRGIFPSLSLSPYLAVSLSCCCCCLAWLVAFALSADSHKFCFAFHFYFIYKRPPSATHTHRESDTCLRYPCVHAACHSLSLSLAFSLAVLLPRVTHQRAYVRSLCLGFVPVCASKIYFYLPHFATLSSPLLLPLLLPLYCCFPVAVSVCCKF